MQKLIAACEFEKAEKQYEYLVELPDDAILENYKYGVTLSQACEDDASIAHTKRLITRLQVVYIREFRPFTERHYAGELQRLVIAFGMDEFIQHAIQKQKIVVLKANLERRLAEMSIFEKIKSLGVIDPDITTMAEELKKLMGGAG